MVSRPDILTSNGHELSGAPDHFGELTDSNHLQHDVAGLRNSLAENGYLLLRDFHNRDDVLAARGEILRKLDSIGEIDHEFPLLEAVFSGNSMRPQIDTKQFARELRTGTALRALLQRGRIMHFFYDFFGETARTFDYIWVRTVRHGGATGCHYDWVYMGRGSNRLLTVWTPIGDVPMEDGALLILENSHRLEELKRTYGSIDVDRDRDNNPYGGGWLSKNPAEVRERFGGRWLGTNFKTGDVLIFTMHTMHCSLDNQSPRIRLSTDSRYQPASDPVDERWIGEEPIAHDVERQRQYASERVSG